MNALKHGRNSKQFAMLGALLASEPTIRGALLGIAHRKSLKEKQSTEVAAYLLTRLIEEAHKAGKGQLNLQIPTDDLNSIVAAAAEIDPARYGPSAKPRKYRKNNSPPDTPEPNQ